jgi:hypothetical protein
LDGKNSNNSSSDCGFALLLGLPAGVDWAWQTFAKLLISITMMVSVVRESCISAPP